jgi:hypothetical protein
MFKSALRLGTTFVVVGLACAGCASGSGDGGRAAGLGNPRSVSEFCDARCTKQRECDRSVDSQTCTSSCKSELADGVTKFRADYLMHIADCYATEDCATVLAGDALGECVTEVKAVLAPTRVGAEFCSELERISEECGDQRTKADCYGAAKTINDATFEQAKRCLAKSCQDMDDCLSATL